MAQVIADRRDVDFVLFEQLEVEALSQHEIYAEFNRKTIEMVVSEARNLAIKEIYPTQQEGDSGCTFENGQVHVPECYRRPWEMYLEGEWLALTEDPEYGGQRHAADRGHGHQRLSGGRQLCVCHVCRVDPRRRPSGGGLWHRGDQEALSQKKCSPGNGPAPCC